MDPHASLKPILKKYYGLNEVKIQHLSGYEDLNYLVVHKGEKYLCKISADANLNFIETQHKLLRHIADAGFVSSKCIPTISNTEFVQTLFNDKQVVLRLFDFLEGDFLINEDQIDFRELGAYYARLANCLVDFKNTAFYDLRDEWNLLHAQKNILHLDKIFSTDVRRICHYFLQQFNFIVKPRLSQLDYSIIHGDLNLDNLLKVNNGLSIIDFGDMNYGPIFFDLGIGLCYAMLGQEKMLEKSCELLSAYNKIKRISSKEIELLYYIIGARAAVSICQSSKKIHQKSADQYSSKDRDNMISFLTKWLSINPVHVENSYRNSCGIEQKPRKDINSLLQSRQNMISQSMSLSYENSIYMTKAAFQYMYDSTGKSYLDCVNNIPHVGHCHPHVVDLATAQMAKLNTNTRYHYEIFYSYAERLLAKFPEKLNRIFFVNSGSAATDLAIRLSKNYTGKNDSIVIDGAYHGNTLQCINLSPYKFNGKGGKGKADDIHVAELPDVYRGKFGDNIPKYVDNAIGIMKNTHSSCFIAESILSCGGQIVLPIEYMKQIYAFAAEQNILMIADEVQVGFGRVGHHFWGYQLYDVLPDIVLLGKPIGNGHPMAAVVTTDKIADAFHNGMEFFSSFGGNPVSCAIGSAVLDVIEQEKLQENALALEELILSEWNKLVSEFDFIGDARGKGLFLGLECVGSKTQRTPDAKICKKIVESMKEKGYLLSGDGPQHNVIKFKPPMVFNHENAEKMNAALLKTCESIQAK